MFGLGNSVRAPSLKLYHRFRREPRLIRLARISFRFRQCLMAKYRHYLVGGTPCLSEPPASGLAKAMRLTIERETGGSDRIADPLTETVNRKRPTIFSVDDRRMVALGGSQNRDQVAVERNRELASGWTDGFAEGSVGARPCGNWNIFLAGSGHWGPIAIQPKGDSKCHRCVCG